MRFGILSKLILRVSAFFILFLFCANLVLAQVMSLSTSVSMDLRLVPTSIVVTPAAVSVDEGSADVPFTAIAKYDYPSAPTPIPDRDVTADSLTTWGSSNMSVALVNTVGMVTPVSDLGLGAANSTITATYGGVSGNGTITVNGVLPPPPPPSSTPITGAGGNFPAHTQGCITVECLGEESTTTLPPVEETTTENPPVEQQPTETTPPAETTVTPTTSPTTQTTISEVPLSVFGNPVTEVLSPVLPLDQPITEQDLIVVESQVEKVEFGVSRSEVVRRVAQELGMLKVREKLLEKCKNDLENCTNIFRMNSQYDGINLDRNNLVLFPDIKGDVNERFINDMTLLGVVNGYYNSIVDGMVSPFLPERGGSNAEALKLLTSAVSLLEKSDPNYVDRDFDYAALFYIDVYGAMLLSEASSEELQLEELPVGPVSAFLPMAHALTQRALDLIRNQKTPFIDVRPDLYDGHWYYPIVYNQVCDLEVLECEKGSSVNPDKVPELKDLDLYFKKFKAYLDKKDLINLSIADDDLDKLLNVDEKSIYLTGLKDKDTDQDLLIDGDEVIDYKTDPNKQDTDFDTLIDGDEVQIYKTSPIKADTDDDFYSDKVELDAGSNPLNKDSVPDDKNGNSISDKWELQYGIEVKDGTQDTDGDGITDTLEYKYQTDPTKIDTDQDGLNDAEEILETQTNPNDKEDPRDSRNLDVVINNFQYGQIVTDPSPMIKGVGPSSLGENQVLIQILLRNEYGHELMLGETTTDARGRFIFLPKIKIKDGTYFLLARSINGGDVKLSKPLLIKIDTTLVVEDAKPEKLEEEEITEDVIINNLSLDVSTPDGRPTLYGQLSEFGSTVNVTWSSLVVSSALIADTADGSFSFKSPVLEDGKHTVYIQTVRKKDNAQGKTIKISFNLAKKSDQSLVNIKGVFGGALSALGNLQQAIGKNLWQFIVAIILFAGAIYLFIRKKE